jgi:hypothetical protein
MGTIELHCVHCSKVIKAPADAGGRTGKCPYCGGENYIPRLADPDEEIPLAPLDDEAETKHRKAVLEDAAYQRRLLHERAVPGDGGKSGAGRPAPVSTPQAASKQLTGLIVNFVEAMSLGRLDKAEEVVREISKQSPKAKVILDELAGEDLTGYGLPSLPRPVLVGYLKQLRSRL